MIRPQHFDRRRRITRRALMGGGIAVAFAAGGTVLREGLGRPAPVPIRQRTTATPATPDATLPPASSTTTATVPIGSTLTKVPTVAVPPATRPAFYVDNVIASPPPNAVALTIDDGPDPRYTPQVLAILARYGIHATFCVVGIHARRYPELLADMVNQGHSLTNHSMTHPQPFAKLPPDRLQAEIVGGLEAIYDATGHTTTTFRSPGGDWSPAVYNQIGELGMTPIDWDVDPRDYTRPSVGFITAKLLRAQPGDILLCHDGGGDRSETVAALRTVLPALQRRQLTFVTL